MKLWIDDIPPPDDTWEWMMSVGLSAALDAIRSGVVAEVGLGGDMGLIAAQEIEAGAWRKTLPFVRWSVRAGSPFVEGNARAAMERAEVYWGVRVIDYTSQIRER